MSDLDSTLRAVKCLPGNAELFIVFSLEEYLSSSSSFMTDETSMALQGPDINYESLFEALPGSFILLKNNPQYTIITATPDYFLITGTSKEGITGKGVFEAFPGNPNDASDTGRIDLKASLEAVLVHKKIHHLPITAFWKLLAGLLTKWLVGCTGTPLQKQGLTTKKR